MNETRLIPQPAEPGADLLAALLRPLLRAWPLVVGVGLLTTAAVAARVLRTPPRYAAEASLLVRVGREYAYRPAAEQAESVRMPSLAEMVHSEVEILSAADLAEQVVRALGVARLYPESAAELDPELAVRLAVLRFRQVTRIRPVPDSGVIKVAFEHEDPELAAEAVNTLIERFAEKHVEVFGVEHITRLEQGLARAMERLARARAALGVFRDQSGFFDLDEQRRLLLGRCTRLEEELRATELELAAGVPAAQQAEPLCTLELPPHLSLAMLDELVRQRGELERQMLAPAGGSDRLVDQARLRLLDLELEERRLLRDYGESNRDVRGVRAEIARVRAFLQEVGPRPGAPDAEAALDERQRLDHRRLGEEIELLVAAGLASERDAERQRQLRLGLQQRDLSARLEEAQDALRSLNRRAAEAQPLELALASAEADVAGLERRLRDARLDAELDRERLINVRLIDAARPPLFALGLPRVAQIGLGTLAGLLAGAGLAYLLDLLRRR